MNGKLAPAISAIAVVLSLLSMAYSAGFLGAQVDANKEALKYTVAKELFDEAVDSFDKRMRDVEYWKDDKAEKALKFYREYERKETEDQLINEVVDKNQKDIRSNREAVLLHGVRISALEQKVK